MITVVHAFSRRNAGDGLLVDLSLKRLARQGIEPNQIQVVALDPESFADLPFVIRAPGDAAHRASLKVARSALRRLGAPNPPELERAILGADAIVAVGGGYLHTGGLVESAGVALNHLAQLELVAQSAAPSVYLPQSIGPLRGPVGRRVLRALARVDEVVVRDDDSYQELSGRVPVRRLPDLAVLELARSFEPRLAGNPEAIVVVGRALGRAPEYPTAFCTLVGELGDPILAVQADVTGRKSDREFYRKLGLKPSGTLRDALRSCSPAAVVSVRLHGAIESVLSGVPAIHLSYDRKGKGAYEDLGLMPWLHDSRSFDAVEVATQARTLASDPSEYWDRVASHLRRLSNSDEALDQVINRLLRSA